ncbi:putative protein tag-76 [Trichinella spiralis]|uniref:putative protein tag-76 n=1 Tax=Trichinella spiralis TaxID=6334 RepID=UPI0001EFE26E|nr:putative protein tag-76 [Trichinella spiralis]
MCEQTTVEQFLITELLLCQDTNVAADEVLQLRLKGDIMVNRYHMDIQHPRLKLNCDDNRDIFWAYAVKRSDIFGDPFKSAYDGKSTLFTVDKLHLKQVSEKADTVRFKN